MEIKAPRAIVLPKQRSIVYYIPGPRVLPWCDHDDATVVLLTSILV